jgi:hypothetical protein
MPGKSWPVDEADGTGTAVISFTAGYAPGDVPPLLISAVKLMLTCFYENRSPVMSGKVPDGFEACCDCYRDPVI